MHKSNITGGKHHKKGKKHRGPVNLNNDNKVEYAGTNQVYSIVKKKIGGSRIVLECSDGKDRSGIIPGKFFKKVWMNVGDILLCDLNIESDDSQCYIAHKYSVKDAKVLKSQGKITFDITEQKQDESSYKFTENINKVSSPRTLPNINNINNINNSDSNSDSDDMFMTKNPNKINISNRKNKKNNDDSNDSNDSNDSDNSDNSEESEKINIKNL